MMSKVNNIAHRLVPLCLLLVALAGCRKEDTPTPDTPSGTPIAFTPETATKAAVSGVEDIQNDPNGFRVWGYFQGTTSGPIFFTPGTDDTPDTYSTTVTYDTTLDTPAWTYSPTRYWMNGNYDFAAIYPAAITTGEGEAATTTAIAGTYAPATTGGTPVLTVPNFDATTQADLLVAFNNGTDGTGINGATPPSVVNLTFQHALSCIQLKLKLDADDFFNSETGQQIGRASVTISGLNDISTVGTLSATKTDNVTYSWTPSTPNGQLRVNHIDNPIPVVLEGYEQYNYLGENGLLVIPQSLTNSNGQFYLQVTIYPLGNADESITKEFNIPLLSARISKWEPNTKYIYTGIVTQDLVIEFTVTRVNAWETENLGGFNVS